MNCNYSAVRLKWTLWDQRKVFILSKVHFNHINLINSVSIGTTAYRSLKPIIHFKRVHFKRIALYK